MVVSGRDAVTRGLRERSLAAAYASLITGGRTRGRTRPPHVANHHYDTLQA